MATPQEALQLPVFDLASFLELPEGQELPPALQQQRRELADCLKRTGCLLVRDPRVPASTNDAFLDMMESYFSRPDEQKMQDVRPELAYQVGATPAGVERPRCLAEPEAAAAALQQLPPDARPVLPTGPDVKWRFMWRLGARPATTAFPELNAAPVVPQGLPQWAAVCDAWGGQLLDAVATVASMAAAGFGLAPDALARLLRHGPHLLAPTGSDLSRHGQLGTVLAGYHADLNCITIHGRSRFPGLVVWTADGRRLPVSVPPGCLLLQAGKQLEWLTGGAVKAGMHEVVVSEATLAALEAARAAGRCTWRVSSTVFAHVASDAVLQPLGHFACQPGAAQRYPPTPAGAQVQQELDAIALSAKQQQARQRAASDDSSAASSSCTHER